MREVEFHHLKAGVQGAPGRGGERPRQANDFVLRQFRRDCIVRLERHGTGRDGLPAAGSLGNCAGALPRAVGAGFPAGMGQLDGRHRALLP